MTFTRECDDSSCKMYRLGVCTSTWMCEDQRFKNYVRKELGQFGNWKFRTFKDGIMLAYINTKNGKIEFWGGNHRTEVWYIEKGTKTEHLCIDETLYPNTGSLEKRLTTENIVAAVTVAADMAGIKQVALSL